MQRRQRPNRNSEEWLARQSAGEGGGAGLVDGGEASLARVEAAVRRGADVADLRYVVDGSARV